MNRGETFLATLWLGAAAFAACASAPAPRHAELDPANPSASEAPPLPISALTAPAAQEEHSPPPPHAPSNHDHSAASSDAGVHEGAPEIKPPAAKEPTPAGAR